MINIKTYIKIPGIRIENLNDINENSSKYFIDLDNEIEMNKYFQNLDLDYIDGAITIEYYNHIIMDFRLWDIVDQLWSYFINLVEEVIQNGYGVTYFPDQPVKVEMKLISKDLVLFSIDEGRVISEMLPMKKFIKTLLSSAENFFVKLTKYVKNLNFDYELNKIKSIQNQIS
ncbi:MAG: hypothetical protein H0Z32_14320 [Bacillaceae bacterium]|nr:hypothetical protein [Bacillaceae bacterium]